VARQPTAIDTDKLRGAVRKLGREYVFYMLDDAIDLLNVEAYGRNSVPPPRTRPYRRRICSRPEVTDAVAVSDFPRRRVAWREVRLRTGYS
jgi:hypothetical protein